MEQKFEATMSQGVKIITFLVHLLLIPLPIIFFFVEGLEELQWIPCSICLLTVVIAYVLRPFQYVLTADELTIRKLVLPKKIPLSRIESVEPIDISQLKLRLRLFGSGGLWGWYGFFLSGIGVVNMQCTRRDNLVLIKTTNNKKIVLSPTEYELFISEMEKYLDADGRTKSIIFAQTH